MIDATKISNFSLSDSDLEENILFWIVAAGKNGTTSARLLNNLLEEIQLLTYPLPDNVTPFQTVKFSNGVNNLRMLMKAHGIGNHKMKSQAFWELVHSDINLRSCSLDDLIKIHGIGRKTAAGFLLHTRPNVRLACLDTHVLKFLRDYGIMGVPKSTPGKRSKKYTELEDQFLAIADWWQIDLAELDLAIWNHYRVTPKVPFNIKGLKQWE